MFFNQPIRTQVTWMSELEWAGWFPLPKEVVFYYQCQLVSRIMQKLLAGFSWNRLAGSGINIEHISCCCGIILGGMTFSESDCSCFCVVLHVLPVFVCISCWFPNFLPQSTDIQVRLIYHSAHRCEYLYKSALSELNSASRPISSERTTWLPQRRVHVCALKAAHLQL